MPKCLINLFLVSPYIAETPILIYDEESYTDVAGSLARIWKVIMTIRKILFSHSNFAY